MSTHHRNGDTPHSGHSAEPDNLAAETHAFVRSLLGVPDALTRIEKALGAQTRNTEAAASRADAAISDVRGMAINIGHLAAAIARDRAATDGALFMLDAESRARAEVAQQEIERLRATLVETRGAVNALGSTRPDVDDLDAVSAVHDINAIVEQRFQRRDLDSARAKLATIAEGERRFGDRRWDVAKIVLTILGAILFGWAAMKVGLK